MSSCAVCNGTALAAHLSVAGAAGEEGLIPSTKDFGVALGDIVRCDECGHMQVEPLPTEDELSRAYGEAGSDEYADEEEGQRATAAALLELIEAHAGPGRIADIGCWLGLLLAEARDRGWEPVGVEPGAAASAAGRGRFGPGVGTGGVADRPGGPFDAVVMGDVIEHLVDPGAALRRIRPALDPDGVLALALPDAGSRLARAMGRRWWSVIPTHVHYFTRRSMRTLLDRHGYETLAIATSPKLFTVRYYLGRIGGYSPRLSRALVRGAEAAGLADRIWGPDLRDRMLVIARPRPTAAGGRPGRAGRARSPAPSPS